MVLLGFGVRDGATPMDAWMQQARGGPLGWLLFFTDYRTAQALILAGVVVATMSRRLWALVPLMVVVPYLGSELTRTLKPCSAASREGLAYPSGHTTVMIVVLGMLVLAVGRRRWLIWAAAGRSRRAGDHRSGRHLPLLHRRGGGTAGSSLVCLTAVAARWLHRRTRQGVLRRLRI